MLHNDLGDLVLNGVFTVNGTLPAPIISGDIAVEHATLDAGTLLVRLQRPYAVGTTDPSDATAPVSTTPSASLWDNLTLRLRLLTTNNLDLRGENMHLSKDAVSSLGDISVVFGGELAIRKSPHEPVQIVRNAANRSRIVHVSRSAVHHRT